jgi:pyridoxamine 5'-phosphate oxidase family protein
MPDWLELAGQQGLAATLCQPAGGDVMSVFTEDEIHYLESQRLARIATVGRSGQPHVVPVGFRYNKDVDTIDIGGHNFTARKKWRDVQQNPRVAVVIDDIESVNPWIVRGIEIRGTAEILMVGGQNIVRGFESEMFRITPHRIVSWGIGTAAHTPNARTVNMPANSSKNT